eukprot:TRINITY_DN3667_c0_g1_i4.p1 TRINITY_DN3667_c0_g1~~TRINITY_DN3667_c0_g1_i4.p1  ORF type:complete len:892 (+),score=125.86 TRINITY_DN3667_c0_g1_i4:676-3351(+)
MSCPFFGEKLKIEVITIFCDDRGEQENIFQLDQATLKKRTVDVIDLAYDDVSHLKMEHNTDPTTFNSTRTGRGPLPRGWQKTTSPVMCSYKICYAEFNYWGFQSKVEQFIHQFALRDNILKGHREAFCWIDEWYDLTMADIDRIELETQQELALLNAQILSGDAPSSSSPQAPATQKPDGPNDLPTTSAMDSNKREQSGAVKDDNVEKSPDARRMSNEFKVGSHVPVQHQVARSRSDSSNSTNRVPEQRRSSLSGNQNDQILIAPPSLPDLRRSSISVAQPDQRRASVAITPTDQRSTTPVSLPDQRRSSISVAHPDHRRDSNTLVAPSQVSMYPQPMPEQRRISANFASPIISNNQQRPVIDATRKQKTVQSFANVDPNDFLANLVLQYERETAAIHCDTSDSNDEFFDATDVMLTPRNQKGSKSVIGGPSTIATSNPSAPSLGHTSPVAPDPNSRLFFTAGDSFNTGGIPSPDSYTVYSDDTQSARRKLVRFHGHADENGTHSDHSPISRSSPTGDGRNTIYRNGPESEASNLLSEYSSELDFIEVPSLPRHLPAFPTIQAVKWKHKSTKMFTIVQGGPNHRGLDVLHSIGSQTTIRLRARFTYGAFNKKLKREFVDIYGLFSNSPDSGIVANTNFVTVTGAHIAPHRALVNFSAYSWDQVHNCVTSKEASEGEPGTVNIELEKETIARLQPGFNLFRGVVRGDLSYASMGIYVYPPSTDVVVFSVTAILSAMQHSDLEVRAGILGIVRAWARKGYGIIYVCRQSDKAKNHILSWLDKRGLPFGILRFNYNQSRGDMFLLEYLRSLQDGYRMNIVAAYAHEKTEVESIVHSIPDKRSIFTFGDAIGYMGTSPVTDLLHHADSCAGQRNPRVPCPSLPEQGWSLLISRRL